MRRVALSLCLLVVSVAAFADFQVGLIGVYDGDPGRLTSTEQPAASGVAGLEARTSFWIFQIGASGLFLASSPGSSDFLALTDVGLAFDLSLFRVAASAGWNWWFSLDGAYEPTFVDGMNLKGSIDVNLGPVALGFVSYWIFHPVMVISQGESPLLRPPVIGLTAMITLGGKRGVKP